MTALRRTLIAMLAAVTLSSAALAAPNGTPDPVANCINSATIQFNLDYALCTGIYPPEASALRAQCQSQALVKYTLSMNACGTTKTSSIRNGVSPSLKQNTDPAFLRRIRF